MSTSLTKMSLTFNSACRNSLKSLAEVHGSISFFFFLLLSFTHQKTLQFSELQGFSSIFIGVVRKKGDSNPRYPYEYVSLANWWFQPLTHPSGAQLIRVLRCKDRKVFLPTKQSHTIYLEKNRYFWSSKTIPS